jgi:small subunit ribosomal protein S17
MSQAIKVNRTLTGRVISNKMDKTINVSVERKVKHPKYGKYLKRSSKILAHDAENQCQEGDIVIIQEGRPVSKRKAWSLVQVVVKSVNQQPVPEETAG